MKKSLKSLLGVGAALVAALAVFSNQLFATPAVQNSNNKPVHSDKPMKILVIGGTGSLGPYVIEQLLESNPNAKLRLMARDPDDLAKYKSDRVEVVKGDVLKTDTLEQALDGVDAVYAGLSGNLEAMAQSMIDAMNAKKVKRLVWITGTVLYYEADGGHSSTGTPVKYIKSAMMIDKSNLNYTLIRPQWFSDVDEINYETTTRNEKFKNINAKISRKSIAHLVAKAIYEDYGVRESLGINRPE